MRALGRSDWRIAAIGASGRRPRRRTRGNSIKGPSPGCCLHQSIAARNRALEASRSRERARSSGDPILPRTSAKRCREPFGTCPGDVGIDLCKRLVGNTLQCFAKPDQETFNCKLALVVGQVTDFSIAGDQFLCFAAGAHCRQGGAARRRRTATTGLVRRHGRDRHRRAAGIPACADFTRAVAGDN